MQSFLTEACRYVLAAALAAGGAFAAADHAPGTWPGEVQANGAAYIPLESIRSFYKLTPMPSPAGSKGVLVGNSGISLAFRRQSCEASVGGYRCLLVHPAAEDARGDILISKVDAVKLLDPVLRPSYITPRCEVRSVVIDPGHGGHDVGIIGNRVREADFTLLLARKLKDILTQRGLAVVLTREQNHAASDRQRVDAVARADAPVFISLHVNSGRSDIKGIETYSLQPAESPANLLPGNKLDEANAALAFCVHSAMLAATGAEDGACRRARFSLLTSVTCPAAMVLVGYATHAEEAAALNTEEYQSKIAQAVADGICTFAKAMAPDATVPVSAEPVDTTPPTPYKAEAPEPKKSEPAKKNASTKRSTPSKNTAKQGRNKTKRK